MSKDDPSPHLEHSQDFLSSLAVSPRTVQTYGQALDRLASCLHQRDYGRLRTTTPPYPVNVLQDDVLVVFFEWLTRNRNYQPRTVAVYLSAVRRFLVWLDAHDYLAPALSVAKAENRLAAVKGKSRRPSEVARAVDPELPRVVTYYDRLPLPPQGPRNRLKRLRLLRDRAIVHTLYASAGRVSEVASLTRGQVLDGRLDEIWITGKGGRERVILLTPDAQQAIAAYCAERQDAHPGLFVSHGRDRGTPLGRWALWKVVKDAAKALDLYQGTSPHHFRHYRARQLLHEGMDLEVLQAYLGHADIATTRRIYAPYTALGKVKDQLATFGRPAAQAAEDTSVE
jgi:integrase/recombinase XerD